MKFRRTLLGLAAVATALATLSGGAMAQAAYKAEYKMSLVLGPPTPWGMAGKIWSDLVKERTQGRINIKLYPGARHEILNETNRAEVYADILAWCDAHQA